MAAGTTFSPSGNLFDSFSISSSLARKESAADRRRRSIQDPGDPNPKRNTPRRRPSGLGALFSAVLARSESKKRIAHPPDAYLNRRSMSVGTLSRLSLAQAQAEPHNRPPTLPHSDTFAGRPTHSSLHRNVIPNCAVLGDGVVRKKPILFHDSSPLASKFVLEHFVEEQLFAGRDRRRKGGQRRNDGARES